MVRELIGRIVELTSDPSRLIEGCKVKLGDTWLEVRNGKLIDSENRDVCPSDLGMLSAVQWPESRGGVKKDLECKDRGGENRGGENRGGEDRGENRGGEDRGGEDRGGEDRGGEDRGGEDRGGEDRGDVIKIILKDAIWSEVGDTLTREQILALAGLTDGKVWSKSIGEVGHELAVDEVVKCKYGMTFEIYQ